MQPQSLAHPSYHSKFTTIACLPEQIRDIVYPLVGMSLLVLDLDHNTHRKELLEKSNQLQLAKKKLAVLMERKLGRPFDHERFSNLGVTTNPLAGGFFELTFNETTPTAEGGVVSTHRIRLAAHERTTVLERFISFVRGNSPTATQQSDLARELIRAAGI